MAAPLPTPIHTTFASATIDLFAIFLTSYFIAHLVWPSSSTKHFFTGIATVIVVIVIIHSVRIPPVDRSIADKVLRSDKLLVVGHRGGGYDAPENTIAAIRESKKNGADGVEIDLEFTKDGVPVLLHDSTVDRTTDGHGPIKSFTFQELRKLNASHGHRLSNKFPNERIPTLEEATEECLKLGLKIFYDVKGNAKQAANALTELYRKHTSLYESGIVCSFYPDVIYRVRLADPNIVTALTHRTGDLTYDITGMPRDLVWWQQLAAPLADMFVHWSHHSWLWYVCGNSAFVIWKNEMSQQVKVFWEHRGIRLITWTVNSVTEKKQHEEFLQTSYITDCLTGDCHESKH